MAKIVLEKINKVFPPNNHVLKDVSVTIEDKEFVTILGPTGSGKTTLLRIISGLELPTSGKVFIDGEDVTFLPPQKRNVSFVFQEFALYPHMNVYENIVFGLKSRGYTKHKIHMSTNRIVNTLLISELLNKLPSQLSWGQKQRVALARALVREPKVFLFDEPLSNLDARLRERLRIELKKIHKQFMVTSVYVTHDQIEAMSLSDKIVLIKDGTVWQVGTPYELYFAPKDIFVAQFIGVPEINLIEGRIVKRDDNFFIDLKDTDILLPTSIYQQISGYKDKKIIVGIRPENLYDRWYYEGKICNNLLRGRVKSIEFLGDKKILFVEWYQDILRVLTPIYNEVSVNDNIDVVVDISKIILFDIETGQRIV
jgi:multiple sugar transport system ATP-binding protein